MSPRTQRQRCVAEPRLTPRRRCPGARAVGKTDQVLQRAGYALLAASSPTPERRTDVRKGRFSSKRGGSASRSFSQGQQRLVEERHEGAQGRLFVWDFHGGAEVGGGLFAAAAAQFSAQPAFWLRAKSFCKATPGGNHPARTARLYAPAPQKHFGKPLARPRRLRPCAAPWRKPNQGGGALARRRLADRRA